MRLLFFLFATILSSFAVASSADRKKILLMDGYADWIIFNHSRWGGGGTNVDDLSAALKDLCNVVLYSEVVSPKWNRHNQIRLVRPDLIIVHLSAFQTTKAGKPADLARLRTFLKAVSTLPSKYIVYSRASSLWNQNFVLESLGGTGRATDVRFVLIPDALERFPDAETQLSFTRAVAELIPTSGPEC
jgi:hypothetical protein